MLKHSRIRLIFIAILILLLGLYILGFQISLYWLLSITVIFIGITFTGVYLIQWNYFVNAYNSNTNVNGVIALTFDDGPDEKVTPQILNILDHYNAKATFFCIGTKLKNNSKLAKEIIQRGHEIGNHSYHHKHNFPILSVKNMVNEINGTNEFIDQLTGNKSGNKLFRPPFGITNPRIAKAVKNTFMNVIGWNIRSFDTMNRIPTKVISKVIKQLKEGSVVLLHDDREQAPIILEGILQYMESCNLRSVTVSELFNFD